MTEKEKRRAVNDYQFVVYTPHNKRVIKDGLVLELAGHVYPYRKKGRFDIRWLSAFLPRADQRWYWDPFIINDNERKKG